MILKPSSFIALSSALNLGYSSIHCFGGWVGGWVG